MRSKLEMAVLLSLLFFVLGIVFFGPELLKASDNKYEPFKVNSTAYYNPQGNLTASGKPTIEGITIAGKKEWLGCVGALYLVNEDGGIGEFIGYREFTDTGYGKPSTKYEGKGTIESGETIDLYFSTKEECLQWGEKQIYVQVIPGKG